MSDTHDTLTAPSPPSHLSENDRLKVQLLSVNKARLAAEVRAHDLQFELVMREICARYQLNNGDTFDPDTGLITRIS